jgi:carboxyl-terminal processing protease
MNKFLLSSLIWIFAAAASAQAPLLTAGQGVPTVEPLKIQLAPSQVSAPGMLLPIELRTPDLLATSLAPLPVSAPLVAAPVAAPAIAAVAAPAAAVEASVSRAGEIAAVPDGKPVLASLQQIAAGGWQRLPEGSDPRRDGGRVFHLSPRAQQPSQQPGLTLPDMGMIQAISQFAAQKFVDPVTSKELLVGALKGMLGALDPYSDFYTPEEFKKLQEHLSGTFSGIGVVMEKKGKGKGEGVVVNTVVPGSPAEKAGIQAGDEIVKVNGAPVKAGDFESLQKAIVGKGGTPVELTVLRTEGGEVKSIKITAIRGTVHQPMVMSKTLSGNVGYVYLGQFELEAANDLLKRIGTMHAQGIRDLVIDLRGNPGGDLRAVNGMLAAFLDADQVAMIMRDSSGQEQKHVVKKGGPFRDMNVKVLVDGHSASASEVFAGGMQDHKRATIIGSDTYGKGVGQNVFPLQDGSGIKLTTFKWFTPFGRSIQKDKKTGVGGVKPDVAVDVPEEMEGKLAQQRMQELFGKPHENLPDPALEAALKK